MQAILKHELMPVTLFSPRNHDTQHANGKHVFFGRLSDRESQVPEVLISLVQFMENQKKHSIRRLFELSGGLCVTERLWIIEDFVLFDRYQRQSTNKKKTRSRRSKNMAWIVGRVIAGREVPLQLFLALGDNKSDLARCPSDERIAQAATHTSIQPRRGR